MGEPANEDTCETVVRDTYEPDQHRTLTESVLTAIENSEGDDLQRTDFALFEDINSEALDSLFRRDAQPRTAVELTTDDIRIELWGDDGVEIRVEDASGGE